MTAEPSPTTGPAWSNELLAADVHAQSDKSVRVQAMFGAIAPRYDLNNRLHSFGLDQRWRREAVRLAAVDATSDVVDIACGTGDLSEAFAAAGVRSVLGVDFTPQMLDIARAKASGRRRRANEPAIRYEEGDATRLALRDRSADVVSIAFGIRNVGDPAQALREFRRILRPGGRLVILEFSEPRNALVRAVNRIYTRRIMPWTATLISGDRSGAYRYLPRSVATFLTPDALATELSRSGFSAVSSHGLTLGVCTITVGRV